MFYNVTLRGASMFSPMAWVLEQREELVLKSDAEKSEELAIGITFIKDLASNRKPGDYQIVCVPLSGFVKYPSVDEIRDAVASVEALS